jgi:Ca2+/Na+ antiporter
MTAFLILLLYLLGDTADSFFCDTLETIVADTKIPPNVAGVTFLAFGNGSPDVFSAIAAFSGPSHQNKIGLQGLIGAGIFVTTVVVGKLFYLEEIQTSSIRTSVFIDGQILLVDFPGAVAVTTPSKLHRLPFTRDILCYLAALTFLGVLCFDGSVTTRSFLPLFLHFLLHARWSLVSPCSLARYRLSQVTLVDAIIFIVFYGVYVSVVLGTQIIKDCFRPVLAPRMPKRPDSIHANPFVFDLYCSYSE